MAMNKKEQAAYEDAIYRAELTAALKWTDKVQKDVMPPTTYNEYKHGWVYNAYSKKVEPAWTCNSFHGYGNTANVNRCQNTIEMYSSKLKALRALRNELEVIAAKELLEIDRKIKNIIEQ